MNIIFYRYHSICEPDYIDAFGKLGVTVIEDMDGTTGNFGVNEKMVRLGNMIADNCPLFVFSINFFPFISLVCNRLGIMYVTESVDCPVFEIFDQSILGEFNRVFLFDKKQYETLRSYQPKGIFYLPLGGAVERVSGLLGDTDSYKYDASLVGSLYKEKDPFLKLKLTEDENDRISSLIDEQMNSGTDGLGYIEESLTEDVVKNIKDKAESFYPSDRSVMPLDRYVAINDFISPHIAYLERVNILNDLAQNSEGEVHLFTQSDTSDLSRKVHVHGGVNTLTEMPFVFRQSRINLNITMRSIQTGIPQRVWDVLACGGFLITNDQPEIHDYFKVGYHLETYKNRQELMEKVNYYLEHDEERIEIARNGYAEVVEKHSVLQRVIAIIKVIMSTVG